MYRCMDVWMYRCSTNIFVLLLVVSIQTPLSLLDKCPPTNQPTLELLCWRGQISLLAAAAAAHFISPNFEDKQNNTQFVENLRTKSYKFIHHS